MGLKIKFKTNQFVAGGNASDSDDSVIGRKKAKPVEDVEDDGLSDIEGGEPVAGVTTFYLWLCIILYNLAL